MGDSFVNYLRLLRINKSKMLLKNTDMNIEDIAKNVGYASSVVLIRNFKKVMGITPSQYRTIID